MLDMIFFEKACWLSFMQPRLLFTAAESDILSISAQLDVPVLTGEISSVWVTWKYHLYPYHVTKETAAHQKCLTQSFNFFEKKL